MPVYDGEGFEPPAPVARVTLRNPDTGAVCSNVAMLLDTGADVTLVPRAAASELGLSPTPGVRYELQSFDGATSSASVVQLELLFCRRTFRGQFLLCDREPGVLGRNVLNFVRLLLDGPSLTWDEYRVP
jgi:predicted aspartyl protease